MRAVQWCSGLHCRLTHTVRLNLGPWSLQVLYLSAATVSSHSSKKYRAGTLGYSVVSASSIINWQPVVSASCSRQENKIICSWQRFCDFHKITKSNIQLLACGDILFSYCPLFLFIFRLGKLQDSQKKLRLSPWGSRSGSAVRPPATFWR